MSKWFGSSATHFATAVILGIGILFFSYARAPELPRDRLVAADSPQQRGARLIIATGEPWRPRDQGPSKLPPAKGPLASIADDKPLPNAPGPLRLQSLFPKFIHEPFETAGFNALALPFRYESPDQSGDDTEAMALTFLLSSDLDWAPGSYCSRHAFFVYRRSNESMRLLRKNYDPRVIASLIKDWKSTCAVGGMLRRTANGLTATLEIYGPDGAIIHTADFKTTQQFFDLLGDISCDALTFFNAAPSPALVKHLHETRCKNPESLLRLGGSANLPARRGGEFEALSQVLDDDPDFAEVRAWLANQREWSNDDKPLKQRELIRAQQSRLTPALDEMDIGQSTDPQMVADFENVVQKVELLIGPDAPVVLRARLELALNSRVLPSALLQKSLDSCRKYPNDYQTCCLLADDILSNESSPIDTSLGGSLAVTAMLDRWMDATGDRAFANEELADALSDERGSLSVSTLDRVEDLSPVQVTKVRCLINSGHFKELFARLQAASPDEIASPKFDSSAALLTAASINDSNPADGKAALDWVESKYKEDFAVRGSDRLLLAYNDAVAGRPVDMSFFPTFVSQTPVNGVFAATLWQIALAGDIDTIMHRQQVKNVVWQMLCRKPNFRCLWPIWDAYEKQSPTPLGWYFYHTLLWLYPNDLWVQHVAAVRLAAEPNAPATHDDLYQLTEFVLKSVKEVDYPQYTGPQKAIYTKGVTKVATPWAVAADIEHLLDIGDTTKAHEIAIRYQVYAVLDRDQELREFAGNLLRRTSTVSSR